MNECKRISNTHALHKFNEAIIFLNKVIRYGADHLDGELELVVHLRHQKIMAQSLPHLHDPHNGSIDLILTILKDPFGGAGLLLHLREHDWLK